MLLSTGKTDSVRFNKYARYQGLSDRHLLRSNVAAQYLKAHESKEVHKLAISKFPSFSKFSPTLRCVSLKQACPSRSIENCTTKTTAGFNPKSAVGDLTAELVVDDAAADLARSDRKLLKGSVPQLQDWADTWEAVTENQSIRKQQRSQKKRGNVVRSRQCIRKQRRILADDSREKHRKRLREATSITLALDEGKYKKVVRFRCDTPAPVADGKPAVAKGILGIVDCSHESTAEFEEDHAVVAVKQLDELITRFCSARGPGGQPLAPDLSLKDHILKRVRTLAADGAPKERRALAHAVKTIFRNCKLIIRDSAHAIRIAVKKSLHADECFNEVWTELFDKRHALAPDNVFR